MNWTTFEKEYGFEQNVFDLTTNSLALLAESDMGDHTFSAFAFNIDASCASISLSFDTDLDCKEEKYYPPDWMHEVMEYDVPEIREIWSQRYDPIRVAYESAVLGIEEDDSLKTFRNGFLNSLRRIMVRLEREKVFDTLKTTEDFWTLVTQVDADTDLEERLLDQARKQ